MGIEASVHVIIHQVDDCVRDLARKHAELLVGHSRDEPADVAMIILRAVAASERPLFVWGMTGKWLAGRVDSVDDLSVAINLFVAELEHERPDSRLILSYEHDGGDPGDTRSSWSSRCVPGAEERTVGEGWQSFELPCSVLAPNDDHDAENSGGDEAGTKKPTWDVNARRLWVLAHGSYSNEVAFSRQVRKLLDKSPSGPLAECLAALSEPREDSAWRTWSAELAHGSAVDVMAFARALRTLGVTIGYQPKDDTAKLVHTATPQIHYDLPVAPFWTPALVERSGPIDEAPPISQTLPTTGPSDELLPTSTPLRASLLRALESASMIGLKKQPAFTDLLVLPAKELLHLVIGLLRAPPPEPVGTLASMIVVALLDTVPLVHSDDDALLLLREPGVGAGGLVTQLSKYVANAPPSERVVRAVLASTIIKGQAAQAPARPDKYYDLECAEWRARTLLRDIQGSPPFAVELWAANARRDLQAMNRRDQEKWNDFLQACDTKPPPFARAAASLSQYPSPTKDSPSRALAWLSDFAQSGGTTPRDESNPAVRRNTAVLEGLVLLAERAEDSARLDVLLSVLSASFRPTPDGAAHCARLGFRVCTVLARLGETSALRALAESTKYPRVRRYLTELTAPTGTQS